MPATTVPRSTSTALSDRPAPRSTGLLLPELLLEHPGTAIRRERELQLGFDEQSGTYHLSIASPLRTL